jgi:uncharacterized protein
VTISFDPAKDHANVQKHGVSLGLLAEFQFESALIDLDDRDDYGEDRMIGIGFIGDRLFVAVFVETELGVRAISLRPAQARERKRYAEAP